MIIGRYLNKEVIKTMLVVLFVLLILFMGQRFVLYLTDAAKGRIDSEIVLQLLLFQAPVFISYLLPLALFLGVLITFGKLYADHEMAVLSACGISKRRVLFYFIPLTILVSLLTGYLTLFQAPTAVYQQQEMIKEQKMKGDLSLITPGRFQQTSDGKKIIYIEDIKEENQLQRIFFAQQSGESNHNFSLILSEKGRYWSDDNQQNYLVLEKGNQYQGSPGSNKLQTSSFERYFMALTKAKDTTEISKLKAISSSDLLSDPTMPHQAELQWRLAAPLSVPLLILLALPLAKVQPRQGKFARILPGLLIYIVYMGLIVTVRGSIEDNKINPWIGTWWIHLLLLGYAFSEFSKWQWLKSIKTSLASDVNRRDSQS
ncbi:MAG: LPS export ABC transporter permease LptF [Gammaproteobacteria bacterium]|nr:LPS export ABC transporter permease LptF [Gammaproteobacteria bacterium]